MFENEWIRRLIGEDWSGNVQIELCVLSSVRMWSVRVERAEWEQDVQ